MKTEPYKIEKRYRGQYQVLDADGRDMLGKYVSLHTARQTVMEHKLQEKALHHPKLLRVAESITALRGEELDTWLYQFLIYCDSFEMRKLMQKPNYLKQMKAERDRRNTEARRKSINDMNL